MINKNTFHMSEGKQVFKNIFATAVDLKPWYKLGLHRILNWPDIRYPAE